MKKDGNVANLIVPSSEQARINGRKGGKKSAEVRRQRKALKEELEILLNAIYMGENGEAMLGSELISMALLQKRFAGNVRAFEMIRDTIGEKPAEKVEIHGIDNSVVSEVEAFMNEKQKRDT